MEELNIRQETATIANLPLEERAAALDGLVAELERRLECTSAAPEDPPRP